MKKNYQSGQGLTEYAVIVSLIAVAALASVSIFGGAIKSKITYIVANISGDETLLTKSKSKQKDNVEHMKSESSRKQEGMKNAGESSQLGVFD